MSYFSPILPFLTHLLSYKKTLPEISQFLSECPLSIDKTFSIQEEQKQFQVKLALCKGNDEIMTEFIKFRKWYSLEKPLI